MLFCALCLGLLATGSLRADDKAKSKGLASKDKVEVPVPYSLLNLSDEQKQKIGSAVAESAAKIKDLQQQLSTLMNEQREIATKFLTEEQKTKLKELMSRRPGLRPAIRGQRREAEDGATEKKEKKDDKKDNKK
jgi:hypothetical protein